MAEQSLREKIAEELFACIFPGRTCTFHQLNSTWQEQIYKATDQILALLIAEIDKLPNPYNIIADYGHGVETWKEQPQFHVFEQAREAIKELLEG